jgi:hypothetical protein
VSCLALVGVAGGGLFWASLLLPKLDMNEKTRIMDTSLARRASCLLCGTFELTSISGPHLEKNLTSECNEGGVILM